MISLKQAIVVEGKYDKITLENIVDATIVVTNGFSIFKDKEKRDYIRLLAEKCGIIVMTDSDSAGALLRAHLKQICPENTITNVYVPQLFGKERRKTKASKDGLLGVEGMSSQIIVDALARSGIIGEETSKVKENTITKQHLFELGLSGSKNSTQLRNSLAQFLNLPTRISGNAFLDCLNAVYNYNDFIKEVELWQLEADKR